MTGERLDRREVVARLLRDRGDAVVVSGLGAPTWDVAALGDHPRNFPLWGAMGGCVPVALGLALAQPQTPVIAVTGDGEMMMGLGSLAVVGQQAPSNLAVIVLDNGEYGETGAQRAHTADRADLAAIARGAGIEQAVQVADASALEDLADRLARVEAGPLFACVKIKPGPAPRQSVANALRDAAHARVRLREALGLPRE